MEIVNFFIEYYNTSFDKVAYTKEALNENTEIFAGNLDCQNERIVFYPNLKVIIGDAHFNNLVTAIGLENLNFIIGSAYFHSLRNADGLENLKLIAGDAFFDLLARAKGIKDMDTIAGLSYFGDLKKDKYIENIHTEGPVYAPRIRKKKVR